MSLSGTTTNYLPPTLDGLNIIEADEIYINGVPIDTQSFVPYNGALRDVNLGNFSFQTLSQVRASEHVLSSFESTMMTSPTTSSIYVADSWSFRNTIEISSLGSGSFLSTSYLRFSDSTNNSTLLTLQSDGITDFANTKVRVSTMATNEYDVVNLSTLTSAVVFVENVNALNYVPYTNALQDLNMMGSTITTTGLMSAGAVRITSSIGNADYTLSVNPYDQLEFTNLSNGSIFKTNGSDLFVSGNVNCATLGATNVEAGSNIYVAKGSTAEWRTTLGMSDEYEILDNAGVMRSRLSKSTGLTVSTLNITQVPSATPTLALGVNGSGGVVSFAVPTTSGLVPYTGATTTVNLGAQSIYATTARFTGITSATPSLALGVDGSGNLNTFTVPTTTNILPLNNVFTGTNQMNNSLVVYNGLGVASGAFTKQTATAGSLVQITGGGAGNSPYLEFLFGGNSRGYIGNASAVDLDLVAQNGAKLNFYTAGAKRLEIDTAGAVIMPLEFRKVGGNSGTNWFSIRGQDASNSPYIEFWVASVRRCYIGFATTTSMSIMAESGAKLQLGAGGVIAETIDTNGYIGVGTVSPSYKLHVAGGDGNIRAEGAIYCNAYYGSGGTRSFVMDETNAVNWIGNNTGPKPLTWNPTTWANNGYTVITPLQTVNSPGLGLGSGSHPGVAGGRSVILSLAPSVAWGELILSAGYIYTSCYGTINNYTNGGGWVYISDKRCKKDIKDIKTARSLERIMALKPKTYKKIYPEKSDTPIPQEVIDADHIGFLAQDVMETNRHCVSEWVDDNCVCDDDDGKRLGIAYGDINIHMVGAIQEIVKQSTSQATLVQELKKQNDAQQEQINDLQQYRTLSEERFEKTGRLIADQQKLLEFLMAKLK
jgi:hypothetical protein